MDWNYPPAVPTKEGVYKSVLPPEPGLQKEFIHEDMIFFSYWNGKSWSKGFSTINRLVAALEQNSSENMFNVGQHKIWKEL